MISLLLALIRIEVLIFILFSWLGVAAMQQSPSCWEWLSCSSRRRARSGCHAAVAVRLGVAAMQQSSSCWEWLPAAVVVMLGVAASSSRRHARSGCHAAGVRKGGSDTVGIVPFNNSHKINEFDMSIIIISCSQSVLQK